MKKLTLEELKIDSFITSEDKLRGGVITVTVMGCDPSFPNACITQTEWLSCNCEVS